MLKVGDPAPEIDATASNGAHFVLSKQNNLCTVVYFFPKAFTPGCTTEAKRFRDNYAEIVLAGASIVGISTDDHTTQCRFADSLRAPFPMIGDRDRRISNAYGVLWPLVRLPRRVTFIVGPDMRIEAVFEHELQIKRHRDDVLAHVDRKFRSKRPADTALSLPKQIRLITPSNVVASQTPPLEAKPQVEAKQQPMQVLPTQLSPGIPPTPSTNNPSTQTASTDKLEDRFDLGKRVASGASSDIYHATDRTTGQKVAVKILRRVPGRDNVRFERESRVLAELRHPGIVAYVAHGLEPDGEAYLVTEWLEGENLSKRLTRQPLTIEESVTLGIRVATTLAATHARGVIHRDLKPSNLFLPAGAIQDVKLVDFGVSRSASEVNQVTVQGDVIGTPGYMAPEQIQGGHTVDSRADVFSLGCVLFRCLTGRAAFTGEDMVALLMGTMTESVPHARDLNPAIPEPLSDLLARMLSKSPAQRPADGQSVADELTRCLTLVSSKT